MFLKFGPRQPSCYCSYWLWDFFSVWFNVRAGNTTQATKVFIDSQMKQSSSVCAEGIWLKWQKQWDQIRTRKLHHSLKTLFGIEKHHVIIYYKQVQNHKYTSGQQHREKICFILYLKMSTHFFKFLRLKNQMVDLIWSAAFLPKKMTQLRSSDVKRRDNLL